MRTNARLRALIEKYRALKVGHKYALCQAAVANQNERFNETAKLLLETTSLQDMQAVRDYINRHLAQ